MQRFLKNALVCLCLSGAAERASAFSMIGPFPAWQVTTIGYQLPGDVGGVLNLGEEYRYNVTTLTYGYDESFVNYYGAKGIEAVETAMWILNSLPRFSQLSYDLAEVPVNTRRVNYQARALLIWDLKSSALSSVLVALGLTSPERYVWTVREHINEALPVPQQDWVIQRNFDPVTFDPTSYVNEVLYTYQILQTSANPEIWEAVEFEVDPTAASVTSVAAVSGTAGGTIAAGGQLLSGTVGVYYQGLTRDDVGGLRYLYRQGNINVETLIANATVAQPGTGEGIVGEVNNNPWGVPSGGTNAGGTNVGGITIAAVNQAARPGVDKLSFIRVDFDSLVGLWLPLTNVWEDTYVTNSMADTQNLQRTLTQPDILFTAAELYAAGAGPIDLQQTASFQSNDAINGFQTLDGPGQMAPPVTITYNKLGRTLFNSGGGGEFDAFELGSWGSFDGTTNLPVVYPDGRSIQEIESAIMSAAVGGRNPYLAPPFSSTGGTNAPIPTPLPLPLPGPAPAPAPATGTTTGGG